MKYRYVKTAAAALLAAVLVACGSSSADERGTSKETRPGDHGIAAPQVCADQPTSAVSLSSYSGPGTLDPYTAGGDSAEAGGAALRAIYDNLVRYDLENNTFEPHLAESIEPDDGFGTWTMVIRDGIEFGNGDTFDAEAVAASIGRHISEDSESRLAWASEIIESIDVVDERTLIFELVEPWSGFPGIFAGALGMVQNVAVIDEMGQDAFEQKPLGAGAGPYEPAIFTQEEVVLTRKDADAYWRDPACPEKVTFKVIEDNQTAVDAFRLGETDGLLLFRDPRLLEAVRDEQEANDWNLHSQFQIAGVTLLLNHDEDSPTSQLKVRQAISAAISPDVVANRAYEGYGPIGRAFVAVDDGLYGSTPEPTVDGDRARELIEEAKAEGWNGTVRLDCANSPKSEVEACIAVAALLDDVGFDTKLDSSLSQVAQRTKVRAEKDFDIALWGLTAHEENLWLSLRQFHSAAPNNAGAYRSQEWDDALADLRTAADRDEANAALGRINELIETDVPFVVLTTLEPALITRGDLGVAMDTSMNFHLTPRMES